jgi:glycerophosphoryl diester phosphodiesterase
MFKPGGMQKISEYAEGIGPWIAMVVKNESTRGSLVITNIVKDAHNEGLQVHPYTFRLDHGRIPKYASSFEDMLNIFYYQVGIDGLFTDFPDRVVDFLRF